MGFGFLLLGYLVTFLLYATVAEMQIGFLVLLLGYALMARGLFLLSRYCKAFRWSLWTLLPLLLPTLYRGVRAVGVWMAWNIPFVNGTLNAVADWSLSGLAVLFNLFMLYAIARIARRVELPSTVAAAWRNVAFVGLYSVFLAASALPDTVLSGVRGYLNLTLTIVNFVYVICNLLLLLSCNKNICAAEDVEQPSRPSRFGWLNRLNALYDRNHESIVGAARESREDAERRRRERQAARGQSGTAQNQNNKKKKKK